MQRKFGVHPKPVVHRAMACCALQRRNSTRHRSLRQLLTKRIMLVPQPARLPRR